MKRTVKNNRIPFPNAKVKLVDNEIRYVEAPISLADKENFEKALKAEKFEFVTPFVGHKTLEMQEALLSKYWAVSMKRRTFVRSQDLPEGNSVENHETFLHGLRGQFLGEQLGIVNGVNP